MAILKCLCIVFDQNHTSDQSKYNDGCWRFRFCENGGLISVAHLFPHISNKIIPDISEKSGENINRNAGYDTRKKHTNKFLSVFFKHRNTLCSQLNILFRGGGGIFSSRYMKRARGAANARPVAKGTHFSGRLNCRYMPAATDFTNPEINIKLTDKAAPIKSVALLPST